LVFKYLEAGEPHDARNMVTIVIKLIVMIMALIKKILVHNPNRTNIPLINSIHGNIRAIGVSKASGTIS
jgi:hypothetical protein